MYGVRSRSVAIGAVLRRLLGPGFPDLGIAVAGAGASGVMATAVEGWGYAFLAVGPAAIVLGAACGLLLYNLAAKLSFDQRLAYRDLAFRTFGAG